MTDTERPSLEEQVQAYRKGLETEPLTLESLGGTSVYPHADNRYHAGKPCCPAQPPYHE